MPGRKASGVGQGPAKGAHPAKPNIPLDTSPEKQKERSEKGWLKRKMRAYREAHPESAVTEKMPSRIEIEELAMTAAPDMIEALAEIAINDRVDPQHRILAADKVLDRALGKATSNLVVTDTDDPPLLNRQAGL